jgi:lipoprotein-releasing system permease protein
LVPYEVFVGLRYFRARRGAGRNRFVSFIAAVSMLGIALGVAALIVVISVMNGFQEELRNRILSVASHIEIRSIGGSIDDWQAIARVVRSNPHVRGSAPFVVGQAMRPAEGEFRHLCGNRSGARGHRCRRLASTAGQLSQT